MWLGRLIGSIDRKDERVSFGHTRPANAFRDGVRQVVSEAWWRDNLGHVTDRPRAKAIQDRLRLDDGKVGEAWLQRRSENHALSVCMEILGKTVLGPAVYNAVDIGCYKEETMHIFGTVYGALLQSIALENHIVEAPAGFSFINGELMTYTRHFLEPISAIVDILHLSHCSHASPPSALTRDFCRGVKAVLPEHEWDALDIAAKHAVRQRLQDDHVQVAAVLPVHDPTPRVLFAALLGPVVCRVFPPTSEENFVKLGEAYGALLKSVAFPSYPIHAPGGFSYHNGQPMSTPYALAHRQRAAARSPAFFPVARQARTSW